MSSTRVHADHEDVFWTCSEAASWWRVSPATIRRLFREGRLDGERIGSQIRIYREQTRPTSTTARGPRPDRRRIRSAA